MNEQVLYFIDSNGEFRVIGRGEISVDSPVSYDEGVEMLLHHDDTFSFEMDCKIPLQFKMNLAGKNYWANKVPRIITKKHDWIRVKEEINERNRQAYI